MPNSTTQRRRVTVAARVGLHARPATELARAAGAQPTTVRIAKVVDDVTGEPVEAKSVLGLMTLGAVHGDEVELIAEGPESGPALDELVGLLAQDWDATEIPPSWPSPQ